jgi:CubicO group peptidase (beta-lactamase class C family)
VRLLAWTLPVLLAAGTGPDRYAGAASAARTAWQERVEKDAIPGLSVAVAVRGTLVWVDALGMADRERRVAATPETRFGIGSISKSLTMALAGRLADQGRLDLDAPLERYLPDFPHAGQGITVRLVAGHLSGLDDRFSTESRLTTRHFATTREALAEIYKERVRSAPGAEHFYGTGLYTLIAGAIEAASGQPFLEAMRRHVLDPLGMASTVPNDPRLDVPRRTAFYEAAADGTPVRAPAYDPSHKWAGAGYVSTAADLARFGSALLEPGFLKAATLERLFTPLRTTSGQDTGVGLGFRVGQQSWPGSSWIIGPDDQKRRIVHQPGGGPGISGWLVIDREAGLVAVVLSNKTGANVGGAAFDAMFEGFLKAAR